MSNLIYSAYAGDIIGFMVPHVRGFVDVIGDGNCGYRVVALHVYGNENLWKTVRQECYLELNSRRELYERVLTMTVQEIAFKICHWTDGGCTNAHWFEFPDIGHIVATRYNIVVVSYGLTGGVLALPAIVDPGAGPPKSTLVVGHVGNHFIKV